jgi:hypothetical protein
MPALVAAEVPDDARSLGADRLGDEGGLPLRVLVAVGRRRPVLGPGGARRPPFEPRDEPLEPLDVREDQLLPEAGLLQLALDVDVPVLVAALEPRVEEDVRERAAPEAVAEREQVPALLRRDAVDPAPQPGLERHVLPRLEEQRVEEEHAELAVAGPGLPLAQPLERAHVDEERRSAAELDVVRGRVLHHQPGLDRAADELELEQRGVAKHPERPLIRVRDDGDDVVLEDAGDAVVQRVRHVRDVVGRAGAHELPLALELREERRRGQRLPVGETLRAQEPQDAAVGGEDAAVRIAEGPGLESGEGGVALAQPTAPSGQLGEPSSSGFPMWRSLRIRRQYTFAVTAAAATPPAIAWSSRLPVPASM